MDFDGTVYSAGSSGKELCSSIVCNFDIVYTMLLHESWKNKRMH